MNIINRIVDKKVFILIILCFLLSNNQIDASQSQWINATQMLSDEFKLPKRNNNRALAASGVSFADSNPDRVLPEKTIGEQESFWVRNIATEKFDQISATLKAIGSHCYVFVAKDQNVSSDAINKIQFKFDEVIYPTNTSHFGSEWSPGIDNDKKIYLLLSDIKDGYSNPKDGYVAGYFFAADQMLPEELSTYRKVKSNQKEILYIDTYPSNPDDDDYMEIVAHEFQHMIHNNQDSKEVTWVNEACSQIAPVLCGFAPPNHYKLLQEAADKSLNSWSKYKPMPDYGRVYIWNQFILELLNREQFNVKEFFRALTSSKKVSLGGYIEAFNTIGLSFSKVFTDFSIANFINDPSLSNGIYSYKAEHLQEFKLPHIKAITSFPANEHDSVEIWSSDSYIADISNISGNLKISFSGYSRFLGPTHPYFRVAVILQDGHETLLPKIKFIKLAVNPEDKMRRIGSINVPIDGTYDKLTCVIMALAPENIDDMAYSPAAGFIYDISMKQLGNNIAIAPQTDLMDMKTFVQKIETTSQMPASESVFRLRENYARNLILKIKQDLDNDSLKSVNSFIEASSSHTKIMAPYARDISGMLRFYANNQTGNLDMKLLQSKINILDSF